MDTSIWEKIFTRFQARARGYLVRNEIRRAREDFEEIVREIDGGLTHLKWTEKVISVPQFTDTIGPHLQPCISASKHSDPGLGVSASPQCPVAFSEKRGDHCVPLERVEAERDDARVCLPSSSVTGEGRRQSTVENKDGGVMMESIGESSSIWSSLEIDMNYDQSHKGRRQYCLAQEVPRTPEALRLHRNTLTMELLWLQQAIDSRKKYLSLKDRLSVS